MRNIKEDLCSKIYMSICLFSPKDRGPTLSVILGPLVASERWAKKRKLAVNTKSSEITDRWKFAMAVVGIFHLGTSQDERCTMHKGKLKKEKS